MFKAIKVIKVEIGLPLEDIEGIVGYGAIRALVCLHSSPVGYVTIPVYNGRCKKADLAKAIINKLSKNIIWHLLRLGLTEPVGIEGLNIDKLLELQPPEYHGPFPPITVAVCTRDRTVDLEMCLKALVEVDYPDIDILIIDNAHIGDATQNLVQKYHPKVRYVREPQPGLNWARNRAISEARGEIIAFTDDDTIVDSKWVRVLARVFTENSDVMTVTGLVVPYELETQAQLLFETLGGFGRGFRRRWYCLNRRDERRNLSYLGAGSFGTGANMAYRKNVFYKIGGFDPALDVGTVTHGGGDLEMFFRILEEGYSLVYEPDAVVYHRHRRNYLSLRTQLLHNGMGLYSYIVRSAMAYPKRRLQFFCFGVWWLLHQHIRRLLLSYIHPYSPPRDLILSELRGCLVGINRYQQSKRNVRLVEKVLNQPLKSSKNFSFRKFGCSLLPFTMRTVNLNKPLKPMIDIKAFASVRIILKLDSCILGEVRIVNSGEAIGTTRLRDAFSDFLLGRIFKSRLYGDIVAGFEKFLTAINPSGGKTREKSVSLPSYSSVSIVVATLDRPHDLRACLSCLVAQQSRRLVEIVVVDNNPASNLTPTVVDEFPGVMIVKEQRKGLSYARNAGFSASTGDILVTTDDDVTMQPTWLEKLIAPFTRTDVMAVTGNVLPIELLSTAQYLFEVYGGLGKGIVPFQVDGDWFNNFKWQAVPTWILGATANAAFRAEIFADPQIGMMEETLGPGMPSGVGEDTFLFYKILKAGHKIIYEPAAFVRHKHRRDMQALIKQIYDYSKGHVAYHLTTLLSARDIRGLLQILLWLPAWQAQRIVDTLRGKKQYPLSLIKHEIRGNFVGLFALLNSYRRIKREGRSTPYIPIVERKTVLCKNATTCER